jgi:hypothetical protein
MQSPARTIESRSMPMAIACATWLAGQARALRLGEHHWAKRSEFLQSNEDQHVGRRPSSGPFSATWHSKSPQTRDGRMPVNTPPPAATPWLELLPSRRFSARSVEQSLGLPFIAYQTGATVVPAAACWWRMCRSPLAASARRRRGRSVLALRIRRRLVRACGPLWPGVRAADLLSGLQPRTPLLRAAARRLIRALRFPARSAGGAGSAQSRRPPARRRARCRRRRSTLHRAARSRRSG